MKRIHTPFLLRRPPVEPLSPSPDCHSLRKSSAGDGIDLEGPAVVFLRPMDKLTLDGVEIAVIKKNIKNMYLRVLAPDGRAVLSAPKRMPDAVITRFAKERLDWVRRHQQAYAAVEQPGYATGDAAYLWGNPYRLEVRLVDKKPHVTKSCDTIYLFALEDSDEQALRDLLNKWYFKALSDATIASLPKLEALVGKQAARIRIQDMTSRWGTCNTATGIITLNLQLAKRPPQYLEYVIVHELTHLWEPSHNSRFYQLMDEFLPNWRQVRKALKQPF